MEMTAAEDDAGRPEVAHDGQRWWSEKETCTVSGQ
jgi:hypothetical protein